MKALDYRLGDTGSVTVSVVIPTTGRPELSRAIRSARAQSRQVEIVVVNDSANRHLLDGIDADVKLWTGGGRRGGYARNLGVRSASGRFVGFLDDDDEWVNTKLDDQLPLLLAAANPQRAVVGGRHVHVRTGTDKVSSPGPTELIAESQPVSVYLFRRRLPSVGRASMYTSTLLLSRELACEVPWREDLTRHQDWDLVIRLGDAPHVTFAQTPHVVARIQAGSSQSISASPDWQSSLDWAAAALKRNPGVYVDFLAAQTLRYALNARSWTGVSKVLRQIARARRLPSIGPAVIGVAGLVPRRGIERLMTRSAGEST